MMPNLVFDNRNAVPVRLIPFMTGRQFSPDTIALILADDDDVHRVFIPSYHLAADGSFHQMLPKEWDAISIDLDALSESLTTPADDLSWHEQSSRLLPASTFVWLDELEAAYGEAYAEERMNLLDEQPGYRAD